MGLDHSLGGGIEESPAHPIREEWPSKMIIENVTPPPHARQGRRGTHKAVGIVVSVIIFGDHTMVGSLLRYVFPNFHPTATASSGLPFYIKSSTILN